MGKKNLIPLILCIFFLGGCGNAVEISQRDFVIIAGIDKGEGSSYRLTTASAVLSGDDNKGSVKIDTVEGESIDGLFFGNMSNSSKKQYLGHTKTIILGKEVLEDDELFTDVIASLSKNSEINTKTIILGTKSNAHQCIECLSDTENEYGLYVWEFYKNKGFENGLTYKLTLNDVLKYTGQKRDYILPFIEPLSEGLKIENGGIISNNRLSLSLNGDQMLSSMIILEECDGAVVGFGSNSSKINRVISDIDFISMDNGISCCINIVLKTEPLCNKDGQIIILENLKENINETIDTFYNKENYDPFGLKIKLLRFRGGSHGIAFGINTTIKIE